MRPPPPLAEWARVYLGGYFGAPPSQFHRWLSAELGTLPHYTKRGTRLNILAPRGAAKSTWASFAFPLWCALHGLEQYTILTSDTGEQARKYLDSLRTELETNVLLAQDYPHAVGRGSVWRQDRITLRNGSVIEALGTGTKLRGRKSRQHRPTLIVVDDPQNTGHVVSALQRERSWEWLTRDVCNAGSPSTNIVVLGTALHREAIVCQLQHTPGWRSRVWRSITAWPERMDLWREWESILLDYGDQDREDHAQTFYEQRQDAMHHGAEVLWPEREPLLALMRLRAEIGAGAFGSEKQNDPTDPLACEWPPEYLDYPGMWFDRWPEQAAVRTLALDPSKGRDAKHGDYSAIVRFARTADGVGYIEADLARRPVDRICEDLARHAVEHRPDGVAVETNCFQELLLVPIRQAAERSRVDLHITGLDNTTGKQVRIRRLTPYLAQRRLRFKARSPGTQLLVQQLRDFPQGDHDDGPDALEMAVRLAIELWNGRQARGQK